MKLQIESIIGVLGFLHIIGNAGASNILGLFLTHSPSHVIIQMSVVRALVEQGHNVTVITTLPLKDTNPGYRHIFLENLVIKPGEFNGLIDQIKEAPSYLKLFKSLSVVKHLFEKYTKYPLDPTFISFMEEDNKFDLMLHGCGFNDYQLGVAAHFKCPVVSLWVLQPFGYVNRLIGNPTHPEFVPFGPFMDPAPMDFYRRVICFLSNMLERVISWGFDTICQRIYNEFYPPDKYPTLAEVQKNISLVLFNHHFSEGPIRPLVPGLVEIGGIQIKDKPDPLPNDVNEFLENSPNGAIFFSLGSNVRLHNLGENSTKSIFKTLSTLPYNVLWKFESEEYPGNASNILFKKWLPQDDILAHKNLKLFITHAGKGSVTEAEYHQVPMVALPVLGDQIQNAETMESKGHGIALDYHTMTEDLFRKTVLEVMQNDKYKNTVQKFSKLYRDRPLTARQNAVYWIEYVIRHGGAPHMQSPLKSMNMLQENSIDVILFLTISIYLVFKAVKLFLRLLILVVKRTFKLTKTKRD